MKDIIRRCRFAPYRKGMGPVFTLHLWDTGRYDSRGQTYLGYRLFDMSKPIGLRALFEGEDFAGSPMHADDSDETVRSLMSFLCLDEGDTDSEYFEGYDGDQLAFRSAHAEALGFYVSECWRKRAAR